MTKAPTRVPRTLPRPPDSAAPPITTAAMALSSKLSPACGAADASSEAMIVPVMAAQAPETM